MENNNSNFEIEPSRVDNYKMFDRIAGRYDLLNSILSFGLHNFWRQKVKSYLPNGNNLKLLDLATGTGDLLLSLISKGGKISSAVGIDMSTNMLEEARKKILAHDIGKVISLVQSDAVAIPFDDNSFDVVTIAFGIRNMSDVDRTLKQMHRVLKPAGRAIVLEFSLPQNAILKKLYLFYLNRIIPLVASIMSADGNAYRYLVRTIETFPFGRDFCLIMENAGFKNVKFVTLTFGVVCIYYGDKTGNTV